VSIPALYGELARLTDLPLVELRRVIAETGGTSSRFRFILVFFRQGRTGEDASHRLPGVAAVGSPRGRFISIMSKVEADTPEVKKPLAGGELLAAISNSIVGILREHYGRGPMKAKTYALDDIIVVVMRGSGFTALEQTIMDSGAPDRVVDMRHDFQRVMAKRYTETIEALTGRKVLAFLSQAHVEPDITMEIFFVDAPLAGFGAVEITQP
jgi:uncharacterized protein YbcI